MLRRTAAAIATLALVASVPGCSDAVGPGADELSQAEALALAGQLGLQSLSFARAQDADVPSQATAGPSRVPETVTISYAVSRPCQWGGTVASSGSIQVLSDPEVERVEVDISATDVHQECGLRGGEDLFILTGDPDLTTQVHVASLVGEPNGTQSVSLVGAVQWESEDRAGRCEVDFLIEVDPAAGSQSTRGSFCGYDFDVSVSTG
ncbi:MAG: hypothetical protein ACYTDX_10640 [Planctomycetota bacterium]|jgi:hypothetical protein